MPVRIETLHSLKAYLINTNKESVSQTELAKTTLKLPAEDFQTLKDSDLSDAADGASNHENLTRDDVLKAIDNYAKPLLQAIANQDLSEIGRLLNQGYAATTHTSDGYSLLHRAVYTKNPDVLKLLLTRGADINDQDRRGDTPLHAAIESGNERVVAFLLKNNANTETANLAGHTALFKAVHTGRISLVKMIVQQGVNVNAVDHNGNTALHFAFGNKNKVIIQYLIKCGANKLQPNHVGQTPEDIWKKDTAKN